MNALEGKIFISTASADKADKLKYLLNAKGAEIVNFPLIEIKPAQDNRATIHHTLNNLADFTWLIFTSTNGVKYFFHWLDELNLAPDLSSYRIAVIGTATADEIKKKGLNPEIVGNSKNSTDFANQLLAVFNDTHQNVLIPTGNLAPDDLYNILSTKHTGTKLVVYDTFENQSANTELKNRIVSDNYGLVLFMSPSAVNSFLTAVNAEAQTLQNVRCAAIGVTTRKALNDVGLESVCMPEVPTVENMILTIENYYNIKL